jgi:hypothetical protein
MAGPRAKTSLSENTPGRFAADRLKSGARSPVRKVFDCDWSDINNYQVYQLSAYSLVAYSSGERYLNMFKKCLDNWFELDHDLNTFN